MDRNRGNPSTASPNGAKVCSPGRKPLVEAIREKRAPEGRQKKPSPRSSSAPLGPGLAHRQRTRGSRPGLHTFAPLGLRRAAERSRVCVLIPLVLLCIGTHTHAAEVSAQLQPEQIYLGTQALLVVQVVNAPESQWPVVDAVPGLRIERYGAPSLIQDLFSGNTRRDYQFVVTPEKAGTFQIPAVTIQADGKAVKRGPFTLRVREAPLKFYAVRVEPPEIVLGESAQLAVSYQGVRPDTEPVMPQIPGLSIRAGGPSRVEVTRPERLPITTWTYAVTATKLGTFQIAGITFAGVRADPTTLTVSPFVIVGTQTDDDSVTVGQTTRVHVVIRGLAQGTALKLVAPASLKCTPAREHYAGPAGANVFSFDVTPTEPGTPTIREVQLPDGRKAPLKNPVTLSVHQGGQGGILACRGKTRSEESVVGEPFIVDYEVFFRGDLRGAAVDPSQASFSNKEHIKVEQVDNVSYPNWQGQPIQVRYGQQGRITLLSGSGELNGQREQLLRFALKITPMAAGELPLDGLRVIVAIQVTEERRTGLTFFSSSRTQQYDQMAKVPPHRVIDPPGITAPPLYRGAVGAFTFATELDRTTAAAMSPLTLTMKITGEGVGPRFAPPPLTEVPELTRDFDVSPTVGGGEVKDNAITFTQVIRPRSEAVKELPALPLVSYDYKKKKYDTVYSLPIPIQVSPGSLVGAGAMEVTSPGPAAAAAQTPTTARAGSQRPLSLGANYTTLGSVNAGAPLGVTAIIALLVAGPVCVVLTWAGQRVYRRRRPESEMRRQRKAIVASLERLSDSDDFFPGLADALQAYLRLTFDLPPGELSADVLERAFETSRIDAGVRREAQDLLNLCDAGRFASGAVGADERNRVLRRTRALFAEIERRHA
jgi:hypothetical protein